MKSMRPESHALTQALLDHHHRTTSQFPPTDRPNIERYLITYGVLCERANVSFLVRTVGSYLEETARWCADNRWPALNALAVNAETRMPGEGYEGAGGFKIKNWPDEVIRCIRFTSYPQQAPN